MDFASVRRLPQPAISYLRVYMLDSTLSAYQATRLCSTTKASFPLFRVWLPFVLVPFLFISGISDRPAFVTCRPLCSSGRCVVTFAPFVTLVYIRRLASTSESALHLCSSLEQRDLSRPSSLFLYRPSPILFLSSSQLYPGIYWDLYSYLASLARMGQTLGDHRPPVPGCVGRAE